MFDSVHGHSIFVQPLRTSRPTVLDLGANHGEFSKAMRDRFGAICYLAEANPSLARALADEKEFHVWHCAVTNKPGLIEFNVADNDESSSILPLAVDAGTATSTTRVKVQGRDIESLLKEIPAHIIDLVKMDIEGMEGQVLLALRPETLGRISQITVEFHCDERFGFDLRKEVETTIRHLRDNGFLCLNFSGTTLMDVLFVNRRLNQIPAWKGRLWEMAGRRPTWLRKLKAVVPEPIRKGLNHVIDLATGRGKNRV